MSTARRSAPGVLLVLAELLVVAGLLAGCAPTYAPTPVPAAPPSPSAAPSAPPGPDTSCEDRLASYSPPRENPSPDDLPADSTMAAIAERGRLVAGVSADTYLMGSRNPTSGDIEGFDIDLVEALAEALLGDPDAYELRVITAAERLEVLRSGEVDVVARNMTITCDRWEQVAFSAEYYRAGQKVLTRRGSGVEEPGDLAGRRVCAPEGTSSLERLRTELPEAEAVPAAGHTGCLILFQSGEVDAITGDDTVLAGLVDQDPYAEVLEMAPLSAEPYGLGFAAGETDLVRFANRVLADRVEDGRWEESYDRWLRPSLGPAPDPPEPEYGR